MVENPTKYETNEERQERLDQQIKNLSSALDLIKSSDVGLYLSPNVIPDLEASLAELKEEKDNI